MNLRNIIKQILKEETLNQQSINECTIAGVRMDNQMGEFKGIKNDLPKNYTPKIKIFIENEKTHLNGEKLPS